MVATWVDAARVRGERHIDLGLITEAGFLARGGNGVAGLTLDTVADEVRATGRSHCHRQHHRGDDGDNDPEFPNHGHELLLPAKLVRLRPREVCAVALGDSIHGQPVELRPCP